MTDDLIAVPTLCGPVDMVAAAQMALTSPLRAHRMRVGIAARDLAEQAWSKDRAFTDAEYHEWEALTDELDNLDQQLRRYDQRLRSLP